MSEKADSFDLYSLDPAAGVGTGFHGWLVLGKTTLKGDAAKTVRDAVEKGCKGSDGKQAKCFIPRHGIRVGDLDLVICFECLSARVPRGQEYRRLPHDRRIRQDPEQSADRRRNAAAGGSQEVGAFQE